jgi:hypothetical protein
MLLFLLAWGAYAPTWQHEVADRSDSIYTSLALDSEGLPHISAFDGVNQSLRYTRLQGQAWRSEVIDGRSGDGAGSHSALALDRQDRPHISYLYFPHDPIRHLRYAHFDGSTWRIQTLDTQGTGHTSIALDAQNQPRISYGGGPTQILKYTRRDGTSWQLETVDTEVVGYTSLKLDSQGIPHISYSGGRYLRYARFDGRTWRLETVDDLGPFSVVFNTSLVLDRQQRPHIAYEGTPGGLKYAHWDGTAWRIEVVNASGGRNPSLALDSGGRPLMSYHDPTFSSGALKLSRFNGLTWQVEIVDSGAVGVYTSLRVDSRDRLHISYNAVARRVLKYARGVPLVLPDLRLNQPSLRTGEPPHSLGHGDEREEEPSYCRSPGDHRPAGNGRGEGAVDGEGISFRESHVYLPARRCCPR